jgi:uncharacterized protein YbjT (DUF2867 family)
MRDRVHVLLGATGLVGSELLQQLLADDRTSRVITIARRRTGVSHPKLTECVIDLGSMDRHRDAFEGAHAIFCALGTTIKVAKSREQFRYVDHDLPLLAAQLGREAEVQHFLLVSALGANPRSRIFYNRVKGEVERDIRAVGYPQLTIARPSLLLGPRSEHRTGERIAARLGWLMPPSMRPIEARDVARALVEASHDDTPGQRILESRQMRTAG